MEYGAKQLSESCVSAITSLSLLSKALPSITSDSLTCIIDSLKIATIVNSLLKITNSCSCSDCY